MSAKKPMTEGDFLRDKERVVYYVEDRIVDQATGQILASESHKSSVVSREPDFIKIYYKAMMTTLGVDNELPLKFLLALSNEIGFSNDEQVRFYNNKMTREQISAYCDVTDGMVSKYLRKSVQLGILFPTQYRGVYDVNPWLIAKGKWEHIRSLQAEFEFVQGKWRRCIVMDKDADPSATKEGEGA